jgi:hypothetical protein
MARIGNNLGAQHLQVNIQILATLQDIASILRTKGGSAAGGTFGGPIGGGLGGAIGGTGITRLASLAGAIDLSIRAVRKFSETVQKAAADVTSFTRTQFGLGSSAGTTSAARILGQALGIGDIAGLGASLQAATLTGLGPSIAGRYGIPYRPLELGGAVDRGEVIMKVVEGLRQTARTRGMGAAIGEARTLGGGAENLLPFTLLEDRDMANLREFARLNSEMYSGERLAEVTRFNLALAEFDQTVLSLKTVVLGDAVPAIQALTVALHHLPAALPPPFNTFARMYLNRAKGAELGANTEALNRNTAALETYGPGTFGGGARFRSAIPGAFGVGGPAVHGEVLDRYLRGGTLQFGAYSIGL